MNITEFDSLKDFQKNRIIALAETAQEAINSEKLILSCSSSFEKNHQVSFIACDIAIIENYANPAFVDATFTYALKNEKGWTKGGGYYSNAEQAYLGALGHKYHGANSQFAIFAAKMLGQ